MEVTSSWQGFEAPACLPYSEALEGKETESSLDCVDPYGKRARAEWEQRLAPLPEQTRWTIRQMLEQLDHVSTQIEAFEQRLKELVEVTPEMQRLMSLPGVGVILGATIALEIGEVSRFASAEAAGQLCGHGAACARQRRSGAVRTNPARCESLFEVGLCRGRELGGGKSPAVDRAARQPTVCTVAGTQRPQQSGGCSSAASVRSCLSCVEPSAGVSRSGHRRRSDQGGVSATHVMIRTYRIAE